MIALYYTPATFAGQIANGVDRTSFFNIQFKLEFAVDRWKKNRCKTVLIVIPCEMSETQLFGVENRLNTIKANVRRLKNIRLVSYAVVELRRDDQTIIESKTIN